MIGIFEEEQTIRLYANDLGISAAKASEPRPDGAVLVAELFATQKDAEGDVVVAHRAGAFPRV